MTLGVVVIGRNEGERLVRCLASLPANAHVVYVDSGSTDGSVVHARSTGASVVSLDMEQPFTAARARNAGRAALPEDCDTIQFIDGDCALRPDWIEQAQAALGKEPTLAAVFGRRREIAPDASIYNWICDVEWAVTPGKARYFGGDVLMRAAALDGAGGYPDEMIAGEEPDLALRMRAQGWEIACIPAEMTLHDAAIHRFSQWWRRAKRSGHAYAELAARHAESPLQDYSRRLPGTLFWGAALPAFSIALLIVGISTGKAWVVAAAGAALLMAPAQMIRLILRERRSRNWREAAVIGLFYMLAKPAQSLGILRFWRGRLSGRRSAIIEYKHTAT